MLKYHDNNIIEIRVDFVLLNAPQSSRSIIDEDQGQSKGVLVWLVFTNLHL